MTDTDVCSFSTNDSEMWYALGSKTVLAASPDGKKGKASDLEHWYCATSCGSNGLDFRLELCRRFWNHIC